MIRIQMESRTTSTRYTTSQSRSRAAAPTALWVKTIRRQRSQLMRCSDSCPWLFCPSWRVVPWVMSAERNARTVSVAHISMRMLRDCGVTGNGA